MNLFFPLLSLMFLFISVVGANHDSTLEPQVYWRAILPHTPMPSAIARLLQPDVYADTKPATSVNVGKGGVSVNTGKGTSVRVGGGGVNVHTGKGTSVDVGHGGVGVSTGNSKPSGTTVGVGKGGVSVNTGKGSSVNVGGGGVNVHTGKGTSVDVGHGGVGAHTGTTVGAGKGPSVDVNTGKGTSVNVGKGGVNVNTGPAHKPGGTAVNVGKGGVRVAVKPKGKPVVVNVSPYVYNYAASDTQLHDDPAVALFFLRNDLRRGKKFTLGLAEGNPAAAAGRFIPRSEAEAVPFSSAELPSILSRLSIPEGSSEAGATEKTLRECEEAPVAGERKTCATSLEAMVDFATASLGTREVVAVGTEGGGEQRRVYEVEGVKRVGAEGRKGVVACHPEAYAYAVFLCHATEAAEVYEVEMEEGKEGGGEAVKAVAVCHTNTAGWNPGHLAFRVLKVRPGTVPVCHFLPRDHVVWAGRV